MELMELFSTKPGVSRLELDHLSLSLLVTSQLEMLATFQWGLLAVFAFCAFHTKHNFLGSLGLKVKAGKLISQTATKLESSMILAYLLSEDRFGLTTESLLFTIVTTTTLGSFSFLGLLVLRHFVHLVGVALAAVCATLFGNVDLKLRIRF